MNLSSFFGGRRPTHETTRVTAGDSAREPRWPVQAAGYTEGRDKSRTELARIVAKGAQWQFGGDDQVLDEDSELIAWTIEDAAEAMHDLGWFPETTDVNWPVIPDRALNPQDDPLSAADQVRCLLTSSGVHPRRDF